MLAALVSGDAGVAFEKHSPQAIVERVLGVLDRIFKPKGIRVPQPLQVTGRRLGRIHSPSALAERVAS